MRARRPLLVASAVLLAFAASALAEDQRPPRETTVILDRSGAVAHGDPAGDGRVALAFALALTARPGAHVVVFAPALDPPVEGDALTLDGLAGVLETVTTQPSPGGGDLVPVFRAAAARGAPGVIYTSGELDVVSARGAVPDEILAKAREANARPDRKTVNEAARALIVAAAKPLEGKLVALRTPLPDAARSVSFLDALGARVVDLEQPLDATRRLAKELAGVDLPEPSRVTLEGGHATIPVARGSRVVLLGEKKLKLPVKHAIPVGGEDRAWVVDADAPLEVEGTAGTTIAFLAAPRAVLEVDATALRLASGTIHVSVAPRDRSLVLAGRAGETDLERGKDGVLRGRAPATEARSLAVAVGAPGALGEPRDVPIERARLLLEAAEPPLAGARTKLLIRTGTLPAELLPPSVSVTLLAGKEQGDRREHRGDRINVELPRAGAEYHGEATLAEGTWSLGAARAGDLAVELEKPLVAKTAGVLEATLVERGQIRDGAASVLVDLSVEPALPAAATPAVASTRGLARVEGALHDKARVRVTIANVEPGPLDLDFELALPRSAVARAKVSLVLEAAPGWKKPLAAALVGVAGLWVLVVWLRKRALEKRFGTRQLRGLGSNGKMSYERYLLADHREGRWAAVLPPGPTAARVEIGKDGRIRAKALEGSELKSVALDKVDEVLLVHETCFHVTRGLYTRPWVFLERDPTAEELVKRYLEGAPSYDGESRDSDVFVLLDERENMVPPSQRLVPIESARLPQVDDVVGSESDEAVVVTNSDEERVLDDEDAILDPGSSDSTLDDVESDDSVEP